MKYEVYETKAAHQHKATVLRSIFSAKVASRVAPQQTTQSGPASGRAGRLTLPSAATIVATHVDHCGQHSHGQPDTVQACTEHAGGRRAMALVLVELKPAVGSREELTPIFDRIAAVVR